jgi:hypothetical protein
VTVSLSPQLRVRESCGFMLRTGKQPPPIVESLSER